MNDNELLLQDRTGKIKEVINKYGEDNFYISFSGGKDSTVLSALVDMAKIDDRVEIIKPSVPIKQMLEAEGYPFKSKEHSLYVDVFQRNGWTKTSQRYMYPTEEWEHHRCPKILKYQFEEGTNLKISDKCCKRLKEEPLTKWQKENNKPYSIIGIMRSEGGRRNRAQCLAFQGKKLKAFQPLAPITEVWEEWFIMTYDIKICNIYHPPYNFERTGCKGCPFAINLQHELDTLEKYFPNERKQCEIIWKPVYDEYRRIGYRLKPLNEYYQMSVDEYKAESD